jgi:spermidine synthase
MSSFIRRVLFFLFFLSGFSSLMYQVVWTRLAFASFGIITPVLSVVLSVFMLGLAVGSWAGGRWIVPLTARTGRSAVYFYAGAELVIGLGAFAVPRLFAAGEKILLAGGGMDSFGYLSLSALVLTAAILPWCVCMGATFPFMMAYIREQERDQTRSFSFLYLANVLGAMSGTLLAAAVYIELLGFHHTLWLAAAGNFVIAFISVCLGLATATPAAGSVAQAEAAAATSAPQGPGGTTDRRIKWILFSTGFIAMAMEVVWTRAFAPVLKTQVYSFAAIVFTYLGATFLGSWWYRRHGCAGQSKPWNVLIPALALAAFLPVVLNTPKIVSANHLASMPDGRSVLVLLGSIVPFCALLGYLTPGLIDKLAAGNPARAGRAYALNVLGCILGPLFAGYGLLPRFSERYALLLLTLPLLIFCFQLRGEFSRRLNRTLPVVLGLALAWSALGTVDFEGTIIGYFRATIRRDYTATVISYAQGWPRYLLVNGIGMTKLTPVTKFMAHLPLAYHQGPPASALVICFGMGTSFRSAMSWNLDTTAVELVPSVTRAFGFYHADAARFVNATNGHIITDDGRRFLKRTARKFDVIVVDPPPPVEAAGSSLLYSREFYELAKQHLNPGGILQMWFPGDPDSDACQAAMRSLRESFPYLRCFPSIEGWGVHMLGSMDSIPTLDASALAARMPESARQDLLEWESIKNAPAYLNLVLSHEYSVPDCLNSDASIQITDDAPYNEYYLLRRLLGWMEN